MAADDLDQAVRRADPDRWLASRFIADPGARADVIALYAFDHVLARARVVASQSLIAEIRLTWWREALDEIFDGRTVRAHPVAQALDACIKRHDLQRAPLVALIDARMAVADRPRLTPGQATTWADAVGRSTAALAARILDRASPDGAANPAGVVWGLMTLKRAGSIDADEVDALIAESLKVARVAARGLSVAAFPAVVCATLARARTGSEIGKRLRLLAAVLSGRL